MTFDYQGDSYRYNGSVFEPNNVFELIGQDEYDEDETVLTIEPKSSFHLLLKDHYKKLIRNKKLERIVNETRYL